MELDYKQLIDKAVQAAVTDIKRNFIAKSDLENLIENNSFEITNPFDTYNYMRVVRVANLYDLMEEVNADEESE